MRQIKMPKMKYSDTVKKAFEFIINDPNPGSYIRSELEAAVSHWIMNGFTDVPFFGAHEVNIAKRIIFPQEQESEKCVSESQQLYLPMEYDVPFPPPNQKIFRFIDLFAGVGGIRLGFQNIGGHCVFSSEWDLNAKRTYQLNYGEYPYGDITKINEKSIPDHDILLAGFPCQAFSIAGNRKGFKDEKGRGNLFFDVYRIILEKRPKAFLLENVKNLKGHDNGNTFRIIKDHLKKAGYSVISNVLNTMEYGGIPQNRERIYIIGFRDEAEWEKKSSDTCSSRFVWPKKMSLKKSVKDLLEPIVEDYFYYEKYSCYEQLKEVVVSPDTVYQWRRIYVRENKRGVCPTLTANMGTGGHNVPLVLDPKGIRKLTPRECFRLQGFPDTYQFPAGMAASHLYKQAGNSVSVTVVSQVAKSMLKAMKMGEVEYVSRIKN